MSIKSFFKRYWRVICSSIVCIAVLAMFLPCLAYASAGLGIGLLDSLGLGGFDDYVDAQGDIISAITEAITGMTSDEVTAEYYNQYYEFLQGDWWGLAAGSGGIYDSTTNNFNDSYLESMGMQFVMYNTVCPFDWDAFVLYAKARRAAELVESGSFDSDSYFTKNPQDPINISSSGLKNAVDYWSDYFKPHPNSSQYIFSYQSNESDAGKNANYIFKPNIPVYVQNNWGNKKDWLGGVYVLPFFQDDDNTNGTLYSNRYAYFHTSGSTKEGNLKLVLDLFDLSTNELVFSWSCDWDIATYPNASSYLQNLRLYCPLFYKSYADFFVNSSPSYCSGRSELQYGSFYGGKYVLVGNSIEYLLNLSTFTPNTNKNDDWGYIMSSEPFELFVNQTKIDYDRIPDNYTITITGDTIYDYSITDPDSGDTTTINNYITNNYTIPKDDKDDDPGSGGGTVSGDITVGGKVDVSGKIEIDTKPIDININVNTSGSGSDSSGSSGSSGSREVPGADESSGVEFDQDVSLNNYYGWMQEQTTGFSGFMKQFFGWLPDPIVIMLCSGFALVILARFLGR